MSQMQSVSSRPRSECKRRGFNFRRNARAEPERVFCDFIPDLCLWLPRVPGPADRARGTFHLFARVRTFESLTQKPTSPGHRQPLTAFETHNGRSTFAAGTALHAPFRMALYATLAWISRGAARHNERPKPLRVSAIR